MSNRKTCCSAPVPRSCSVTLAWLCLRRTAARVAQKRWSDPWPVPPRTWLLNNYTAGLAHPATSMPWAWWSMNGCAALPLSTAPRLRSPCSTSRCLPLPCESGCPISRLPSRRSCCGRWPKNLGSAFPPCETLLLPCNGLMTNLPLCMPLPPLLPRTQQFTRLLLPRTQQFTRLLLSLTLHIKLLGAFLLVSGETPVTSVDVPRLQSLLAYLVLHRAAPQPRAHLAYLMWPDSTDAQALTNLRNAVHRLRHTLPNADAFLHVTRQGLQWQSARPEVSWTLDACHPERSEGSLSVWQATRPDRG